MKKCPKCSSVLSDDKQECAACGLSISDEFAPTIQKSPDEDHTPTKVQETENLIHTTASDGGRFVAGTVLAKRYRIIGLLGRGGMGEVYKAEDLELNQMVALKFLPESFAKNEAALARFRGEVRTARQVSHPNVCRVFDIGELKGVYYLSMEYVDGDDLSMLLRRIGRLPSDKAVEISRQICLGLHAIHEAGILHRDLKPANIIIDSRGKARITDFGIAGIEQDLIGKKEIVGTPAYMSPEQITGGEITTKSDIYSVGLLLYEIFTGKQAVKGDSINELIESHRSQTPTNPSKFVENINPLVEKVIERCLEKEPSERPKSALQVALSLPGGNPLEAAIAAGETPSPEMIAAAPRKGALKPKVALVFLLLILAGLILVSAGFQNIHTYNLTTLKKSPEILAERAKTIVGNLGYTETPTDAKYKFRVNDSFLKYVAESKSIANPRERLRAGQPFDIFFLYRQSPESLTAWRYWKISDDDPPLTVPGMINVSLDARGRLIEFVAVPSQAFKKTTESRATEWTKLFDEAGLDIKKFEPAAPEWTPPVFADANAAWTGTLADFADIPIRVEAAALDGKPVYFRIVYPWDKPTKNEQSGSSASSQIGSIVFFSIFVLVLLGAILLARHNFKVGRSDVKGCFKLTLFCFLGFSLSNLVAANHVSSFGGEFSIFYLALSAGLYPAAIAGLFYLALEPFARRYGSELLISWNRLLAGDFRDPMIGRDILIGGLATVGVDLIYLSQYFIKENILGAGESVSNNFNSEVLNGWSAIISNLLRNPAASTLSGLALLFIWLLLYIIFRNKKVSIVLLILIFVAPSLAYAIQNGDWSDLVVDLINYSIVVFTIARFGPLAMIFLFIFNDAGANSPLSFDTSSHLFPGTVIFFAFTFALAIYGFYTSTAGQPLFKGGFLDERKE